MKTRLERDPQLMTQCIYSIPCEYGRSYISETDRPLDVWLHEQRHTLKENLLEKSKLAQHASEEGHRVCWDEAKISDIQSNNRYMRYKELAHMASLTNPISLPSLNISPIWILLNSSEVRNSEISMM
jgi:hypothetical protein